METLSLTTTAVPERHLPIQPVPKVQLLSSSTPNDLGLDESAWEALIRKQPGRGTTWPNPLAPLTPLGPFAPLAPLASLAVPRNISPPAIENQPGMLNPLHQNRLKTNIQLRPDDPMLVARATPFLPGISGGIWSPVNSWTPPSTNKDAEDKDAQIRVLREKVERLTAEKDIALNDNARLINEVHQLSSMVAGRTTTLTPSPPVLSPSPSYSPNYDCITCPPVRDNLYQSLGLPLQDQAPSLGLFPAPNISAPLQDGPAYRPAQITVDLILRGKVDFLRLDPRSEYDLIRPLVWTIAHEEPKSHSQAATLKVVANTLGTRLGQPLSASSAQHLITVILEWAKPLCFTSNGNYLCQQLLEKCTADVKIQFIRAIEADLVCIANSKFGAHVLVKAIGVKELEQYISDALFQFGVFESMETGARKVWRPYLTKSRNLNETQVFVRIKTAMVGRWADLAVSNEHGSISVQQIFEGCGNQDLMDACFEEILADIVRIANNQFGHFVINKLLNVQEPFVKKVSHAVLTSYPPISVSHHGVQFVEYVLNSNRVQQRVNIVKYLETLCSQEDGRTPAIVAIANSSVGRGHLQSVLRQVPAGERVLMSRVNATCRQFQTTLRNSQSGNELLCSLGIINTPRRS